MAPRKREIQENGLIFTACVFSHLSPSVRLKRHLDPFLGFSLVPSWKEFSLFLSIAIQIPNKNPSDFNIDRLVTKKSQASPGLGELMEGDCHCFRGRSTLSPRSLLYSHSAREPFGPWPELSL